jgi:phosphatidylglycerol lysyltransferase
MPLSTTQPESSAVLAPAHQRERARALALRYGWNAMAYQIVNDGMHHWFAHDGDAVVGYVRAHGVLVVAGAPICAPERLNAVLRDWEQFAAEQQCRVCYFGAAGRVFDALTARDGYSTVILGAQPVWDPAHWAAIIARSASLRGTISSARNKGTRVSEWTPQRASADLRLSDCLDEWLASRGLPPLHFLIEPHTLHDLTGRRVFVAEVAERVAGFIVASPVPARSGWLVEQFVRGRRAPNGTIELLLDSMMNALAADGARYVTMGLVPLREAAAGKADGNPAWLSSLMTLARAHGRRFYNFRGLEQFKTKFRPDYWEPIYAIASEPEFSPRTMYAIARAFTVQSPMLTLIAGLRRAATSELRRLHRFVFRPVRR